MRALNIFIILFLITSCSKNDIDIDTQQQINKNNSEPSEFGKAVYGENKYE